MAGPVSHCIDRLRRSVNSSGAGRAAAIVVFSTPVNRRGPPSLRAATRLLEPRPAALILCSLLAFHTGAEAASFDCGKAFTLMGKAICSNGELSGLDDTLASLYRQALSKPRAADRLNTSQRAWMQRRDACQNERCLKAAYTKRIAELDIGSSPASGSIGTPVRPTRPGDCVDTSILSKTIEWSKP